MTTVAAAFDRAFNEATRAHVQAARQFNAVFDLVRAGSADLGEALSFVQDSLTAIRSAVTKLGELVQDTAEHRTPVLSLIAQGFAWLSDVRRPMSDLSLPVLNPRDENLVSWSGAAATAYLNKARQQKEAVDDVTNKAGAVSRWLFDVARVNVDFLVELARLGAKYASKLAGSLKRMKAAGIRQFPAILRSLADELGALVEDGLKVLITIAQRLFTAGSNYRELMNHTTDHTRLPNGRWPQAVRNY